MRLSKNIFLVLICLMLISPTVLAAPIPKFVATQIFSKPLMIRFLDISSEKHTSWYWCFGDAQKPDSISTERTPFFTYSKPGHYQVHLKVWDNKGHMSWTTQRITVSDYYINPIHIDPPIPVNPTI